MRTSQKPLSAVAKALASADSKSVLMVNAVSTAATRGRNTMEPEDLATMKRIMRNLLTDGENLSTINAKYAALAAESDEGDDDE